MSSINYSEKNKYLFKCFVLLFRNGIKQEYAVDLEKADISNSNCDLEKADAHSIEEKSVTMDSATKILGVLDSDFLKSLYTLSKRHGVVSIVYNALVKNYAFQNQIKQLSDENDISRILKKWGEASNQVITKEMLFDNELKKIKTAFSENQIYSVPLKGIIIKELYPQKGMRQFCDYDILIHHKDANRAKTIMKELGYSVSNDTKSEEEVHQSVSVIDCKKMPIFNFEIHKKLFWGNDTGYFSKIWDRVVFPINHSENLYSKDGKPLNCDLSLINGESTDGESNLYVGNLTDEDVYLFHLAHFNSHLNERSGAGIRYLADHYFLKKYLCSKSSFNREYVETVLKQENLLEFEKRIDSITDNLFDAPIEDIKMDALYEFLVNGVHGSVDNKVKMNVAKEGKTKFFLKRAFPSYSNMCIYFSILKKMPFLLPFCWIARFFIVFFDKKRRTVAKSELRQLGKK